MKVLNNKNVIFWDFDGVIMDSMPVRNRGFQLVLADYPDDDVAQLMKFHLANGGLSRYVKFRYFFEKIRGIAVSEEYINEWASKFSAVMKRELLDSSLMIEDSLSFIKDNHQRYTMHIVSGSDQAELRYLCKQLDIDSYFKSIHGSPTPKKQLVKNLIKFESYIPADSVLIGDSINDYEAAETNNIDFLGYNNLKLEDLGLGYINNFGNE